MATSLTLAYAVSRKQGSRVYQEDNYDVVDNYYQGEGFAIFAILDGHGTNNFSLHASENLTNFITRDPAFAQKDYPRALYNGFMNEDKALRRYVSAHTPDNGGTTATVVLVVDETAYVANVGDSTASLIAKDDSNARFVLYHLTEDHKVNDPSESTRLKEAGADVLGDRVYTGRHGINMSRALGDFDFKMPSNHANADWISSVPHIISFPLEKSHQYIILASDGLWNVISDEKISTHLATLQQHNHDTNTEYDLSTTCETLSSLASSVPHADNVTVLLVELNWTNTHPSTVPASQSTSSQNTSLPTEVRSKTITTKSVPVTTPSSTGNTSVANADVTPVVVEQETLESGYAIPTSSLTASTAAAIAADTSRISLDSHDNINHHSSITGADNAKIIDKHILQSSQKQTASVEE